MAEIRPFRGVRYNKSKVRDLSAVICPPYDIITPQIEEGFYRRSEYNFIHLEHGHQLPQDSALDNKYIRAATTMEQWLKQGVLITDETVAIYLHDHYFIHQGKQFRRRGLTTRVRLEEWHRMIVRPHEGTLAEPKSDRVSLLSALKANTSPILALFSDRQGQVSPLLAIKESGEPIISLDSSSGERHNVWAITEPQIINKICSLFNEKPLYVADGHHRYESALTYQRQRRAYSSSVSGDEAFNFVLMTLVDFVDPGLIILPPHRLLRGLSASNLSGLTNKLKSFFDIKELPLDMSGLEQQVNNLLASNAQIRLVLFGLKEKRLLVLELRDFAAASKLMPDFHSELYKRLDVSIVDHIILEEILGLASNQEEARMAYNYDWQDAISKVLAEQYQLAFILSPVKTEVVKAIADAGDRMPRKATYFYPKLPSGLVFNRMV
jgi:uncharacterized protein (DUF1015 family)